MVSSVLRPPALTILAAFPCPVRVVMVDAMVARTGQPRVLLACRAFVSRGADLHRCLARAGVALVPSRGRRSSEAGDSPHTRGLGRSPRDRPGAVISASQCLAHFDLSVASLRSTGCLRSRCRVTRM